MYMSGFGTGGSWGMESVKKIDISSEAEWDLWQKRSGTMRM